MHSRQLLSAYNLTITGDNIEMKESKRNEIKALNHRSTTHSKYIHSHHLPVREDHKSIPLPLPISDCTQLIVTWSLGGHSETAKAPDLRPNKKRVAQRDVFSVDSGQMATRFKESARFPVERYAGVSVLEDDTARYDGFEISSRRIRGR